jgi:hypothetical protein
MSDQRFDGRLRPRMRWLMLRDTREVAAAPEGRPACMVVALSRTERREENLPVAGEACELPSHSKDSEMVSCIYTAGLPYVKGISAPRIRPPEKIWGAAVRTVLRRRTNGRAIHDEGRATPEWSGSRARPARRDGLKQSCGRSGSALNSVGRSVRRGQGKKSGAPAGAPVALPCQSRRDGG